MLDRIKHETIALLSRIQVRTEAEIEAQERERERQMARELQTQHAAPQSVISSDAQPAEPEPAALPPGRGQMGGGPETLGPRAAAVEQVVRQGRKVGRNEPCPCGSGKKFKHCHGQLVSEA